MEHQRKHQIIFAHKASIGMLGRIASIPRYTVSSLTSALPCHFVDATCWTPMRFTLICPNDYGTEALRSFRQY